MTAQDLSGAQRELTAPVSGLGVLARTGLGGFASMITVALLVVAFGASLLGASCLPSLPGPRRAGNRRR